MGAKRRGRRGIHAAIGVAVAINLLSLMSGRIGRADGLADEAELLFQIGLDAYQKGDYKSALQSFLHSNRLVANKNVVFNIALVFEKTGRFADAYRYYIDALQGETDAAIKQEIADAIARVLPSVAVLRIETSPPGATIYIDRRELGSRGTTPRPLALPPDRYKVIVELEGYEPLEAPSVEAKLGSERRLELVLKPILGAVRVELSGAPSAEVRVDDEGATPACTAPCQLELPPGLHTLYFRRAGYAAVRQQALVKPRETAVVAAALSPLVGSLAVTSDERDAAVEVDGHLVGFTPAVIPSVPAGRRRVRVTLRGFAPTEREVDVAPNREAKLLDLKLSPLREVTAVSRVSESIDDAPSSVTIIEGQEIQAFGYPTIAEALRGVRGVHLSTSYTQTSVGVRGLGEPNDNNVRVLGLVDGQPLNEETVGFVVLDHTGRPDLHDIDRIEVVRGPGSLLYGTGAFSGVINLVTRPRDEPSHVHVSVGAYGNAAVRARAGFHYNFSPSAGVWASVTAAGSKGVRLEIPPEGQPTGEPSVVARGVDQFKNVYTTGKAWWGPVTAQWLYGALDYRIPLGVFGMLLNDPRSGAVRETMMAEVRVEPRLSETVQLLARVHGSRNVINAKYAFEPAPIEPSKEDYVGTTIGAEVRLLLTPSKNTRVTGGAVAQLHPEVSIVGKIADQTYLDIDQPNKFLAAYGLFESSPLEWLRVSAGVRADVYSTFGPILIPRAAVILRPARASTLKIMGGRAFRAPSPYETSYNDGGVLQAPAVDPARGLSLGPESIYSGEIEYSQRFFEDWVALGAAHVEYIQGLIKTVPDTPGSEVIRYSNSYAPTLTNGLDVELRREWRQGWMLSAMYTYQRGRLLDPSVPNPRLVSVPEHLASLRAVVPVLPDVAVLGARAAFESGRRIDVTSDDTTDPVVIVDLTVSGNVKRFGLRYTLGFYNVGDYQYALPTIPGMLSQSRTVPQSGRTILADLLWSYP